MNRNYGMLTDDEILFLASQEQARNQQRQNQQILEETLRNQQQLEHMRMISENMVQNNFFQ